MMNSLPIELIYEIKDFLDDKSKIALDIYLKIKPDCCDEKEKDYYNLCYNCNKYICDVCYETKYIFFDECYFCEKSICSECTNLDSELLDCEYILSLCEYDDCYYCSKGFCYNNKVENKCYRC